MFLYFIIFIKGSCQNELDHYFKALFRLDIPVVFVTKTALSLARRKLKYSAFIEYNRHLLDFFYDHFKNTKTWYRCFVPDSWRPWKKRDFPRPIHCQTNRPSIALASEKVCPLWNTCRAIYTGVSSLKTISFSIETAMSPLNIMF